MNTATKLWNKNFILYLTAMELSSIGNSLLRFALPLYLLLETGSPALMGTVLSISSIPLIIFLPVGGTIADRYSKRKILGWTNLATAISIVVYLSINQVLGILPASIILLLLFSTFEGMMRPSSEATLPFIVPEQSLVKANSLNWSLSVFSMVASPIIGGFILSTLGLFSILIISIVFYLLASVMKFMVKIPYKERRIETGLLKTIINDFQESFVYVSRKNTKIGRLLRISVFNGLFFLPINYIALPILISSYLGMAESTVGIVQGVVMLGGTAGGILFGLLGNKVTIKSTFLILLSCSLIVVLSGFIMMWSPSNILTLIVLSVLFFAIMGLTVIIAILVTTYFGTNISEELLGKVVALDFAIVWVAIAIGNFLFGWLLNHFIDSPWFALFIMGGVATLATSFVKMKE